MLENVSFKYVLGDTGELQRQWGLEEAKSWGKDIYKKVSLALPSYCFPGWGLWWFTSGGQETAAQGSPTFLEDLGAIIRGSVLANTPGFPLRALKERRCGNRNEPEIDHPLQRLKPSFKLIQYVIELKWLYGNDYLLP